MMDAMLKETALQAKPLVNAEKIETIYFGGGTPSLLTPGDIEKLLNEVNQNFTVSAETEITLEANPDDIDKIKLDQWKEAGINRLSVGVQTFVENDLIWMNRAHSAGQALECINMIKEAGFNNFSVDLIYGTPNLSNEQWKENVYTLIDLEVPHLSCYALTVESNTALHKMISIKTKEDVDPEKQASQFLMLTDWLGRSGYEHYEISNFAKPGFRSKHNSSYWQGKEYIGIGPSAHSFKGETRRWNVSNNALYIESLKQNMLPFEQETLSATQRLNEYIMTSIRTIEGIDIDFIKTKFGEDKSTILQASALKYRENSKLTIIDSKIILTREGKLLADGIASDLFF